MFEINNQVHENSINFLYEAATSILPKANESLNVLKSFYINKTREIARVENLNIPNKIYGPASMCQKCSIPWGEGACKVSVYSTKPKKFKKVNFIMVKREKTKPHRKSIKKFVLVTCRICKNRTKHLLPKPPIAEVNQSTQSARNIAQSINSDKRPQITVFTNKKSRNKPSKAKSNKSSSSMSTNSAQKSKKPSQNYILQLAKLLSSSSSKSNTVPHEDKLKQFLK